MKAIAVREAALLSADGFVGLVVTEDEEALVFAVSTLWQVSGSVWLPSFASFQSNNRPIWGTWDHPSSDCPPVTEPIYRSGL